MKSDQDALFKSLFKLISVSESPQQPQLHAAYENLARGERRWGSLRRLVQSLREPVVAVEFTNRAEAKLLLATQGAREILDLATHRSARPRHLKRFLELCSTLRRTSARKIEWVASGGGKFFLHAMYSGSSAATMIIRLEKAATANASPTTERAAAEQAGLSRRESDVYILLAQGLGNREIARRLHISEYTVRAHLRNIYSKLDVSNRVQAVRVIRGA